MAPTVERQRPSLANEPALRGRLGYEAGDARLSLAARGRACLTLKPGYIRADVPRPA
jgi:hypothetical protein